MSESGSVAAEPIVDDDRHDGRRDSVILVAIVAVLAVLPLTGLVYPFFVMQALCFALFASAFNLLIGYAGLLSFGHAMFLGVGGYASAHAAKAWGLPPEGALACGVVATLLLGALVGALAIRRQGIYFAMVTLALAQMVYFACLQAPFTHGEDGIQSVPQGRLFGVVDLGRPLLLYYTVLVLVAGAIALIVRIVRSPFGDVLTAIRENEPRAISLGYAVDHYKLLAFVLSAGLAGFAGALKALVAQNASLTDVHWTMSGEVVLMTLVGGLGTLFGPAVGAFVITGMQQYLAGFGQWVTVIQGAIFVICVLAFRRGIVGQIAHHASRFRGRAPSRD